MKSMIRAGLAMTLVAGSTLMAQGPGGQGMGPAMRGGAPLAGARAAEAFLSRAGELQLTDAQVVRLAAIARRAHAQREAQRTAMDSMRARMMASPPADSAARAARRATMQATMRGTMESVRAQNETNLRDALAVLNADQQARAWQARMGREGAARGGRRGFGPGQGAGPRGDVRDRRPLMRRGDGPRPMRGPGGAGAPGGMPGRPPVDSAR